MFLICDTGSVRKDSGRLNPTHRPTNRVAVLQSLHGCLGGGAEEAQESRWRGRDAEMLGAGSSTWSLGSRAGARWAPFPWGSVSPGKGGLTPISFTLLEMELRKHQAWG